MNMGKRDIILMILLAAALVGCEQGREGWPWRKKDVPVTPPSEVSPSVSEPGASSEPNEESTPEPEKDEAKNHRPRPQDQEHPPVKPVWAGLPPIPVNRPIMLENIIPGIERIAMVERPPLRVRRRRKPRPAGPAIGSPPETPPPVETTEPPERARPILEPSPVPLVTPGEPPDRSLQPPREFKPPRILPLRVEPPVLPVSPEEAGPTAPERRPVPEGEPPAPHRLPPVEPVEYGETEVVAASLIQVNDKFLTVDDILRGSGERLATLPRNVPLPTFRGRVRKVVLEEIAHRVIELLTYEEARLHLNERQKGAIDNELDQKLRTMIAEIGGSRKKLETVMVQRGTDLETVLTNMRRELTVRYFLERRFLPAIAISRSMLWEYYTQNRSEFSKPPRVQMQIVAAPLEKFLPPGSVGPTERERMAAGLRARKVINEAAAAIKAGEDFGDVARRSSRGIKAASDGIWPMMPAGSFAQKAIEDVAFSLEEGQVSDVIETPDGYYIVKARRIQPGRSVSFEEAQEQIEMKLRQEQLRTLEQDYFQRLRERSHVRQSDKFLDLAVDRAVKAYWQR